MKEIFDERRYPHESKKLRPLVTSRVRAYYDDRTRVLILDCTATCDDADYQKILRRREFSEKVRDERHFFTCSREEAFRHVVCLADAWHARVDLAALEYAKAPKDTEVQNQEDSAS